VIGLLYPTSPDTNADRLRGFRQGLKENGYVEGEDVAIEYRWAENQMDRLPPLAAELVPRQVVTGPAWSCRQPPTLRRSSQEGLERVNVS
jgi:hypothetical protein